MNDQSVINTEGLTKHYGDVRAVVDLDLDIRAGEVFGFLCPNGSGKTTTIRTMLDGTRPTAGQANHFRMKVVKRALEWKRDIDYEKPEVTNAN